MSSTENFFDSLLHQKTILDNGPFLDTYSQRGLESAYFLLHNIIKTTVSRQSRNRHDKARQHLKNIYSIAKPLFVIVAVTIAITDLASLEHTEIFPRLEIWWQNNAPSQKFESRAIDLIRELDYERERGGLVHVQSKIFSPFAEAIVLRFFKKGEPRAELWGSREVSNTRGWNAPSLLPSQHRKVTQLNSPLDFKMPSQDLVVSLHSSLYWDCAE